MFRIGSLRALGAVAFLAASAAPALAQPVTSPTASPTPIPEITHVVTSDRSDETLKNSARTTYVVTQAEIIRNGYRTVTDALSDVPGVEISGYGALGSAVSYGIRGSSSAQVLVLVNGLPAAGSLSNSVDLGQFSTVGVKRIEVVEGGGSTLYGTGAIGGIINIITGDQQVPSSATLRYGSFDDKELRFQTNGVSFERVVANNAYGLPTGIPQVPLTRGNADYEAYTGRLGFTKELGTIEGAFNADLSSSNLGAPGSVGPYLSSTSRQQEVDGDVNLAFAHHGAQSTSTLQLGGTRQQIQFGCDTGDPGCFQPLPSLNTESRFDLGLRNVVSGKSSRLIYGVDLSHGTARSDDGGAPASFTTPPPPQVTANEFAQTAAYAQENVILGGRSSGYVGLRGERDGGLGGELSPAIGFVVGLSQDLALKLNYAHAFRAPNASELYFPGYGNPNLVPERAKVGDATLVDPNVLGGASFGWFTNRTDDLIVSVQDTNTLLFSPQNVDHAAMQGFTLDVKTRPYNGIYTAINATDLYEAVDLDNNKRLPNDPVIDVNFRVGFLGSATSVFEEAAVTIASVGARNDVDLTLPAYDQAVAYTNLDAYARFRLARSVVLTLRGYNLGNERYAEVTGYPMPGRSFAVELGTR